MCSVDFKIRFQKTFQSHSAFHQFYKTVKLGDVIRGEIISLLKFRIDDLNYNLAEDVPKQLDCSLKLKRDITRRQ